MDHPVLENVDEIHVASKTSGPLNDIEDTTSKQIEGQHKDDTSNDPKEHHENTRDNGEKDMDEGEGSKDKNNNDDKDDEDKREKENQDKSFEKAAREEKENEKEEKVEEDKKEIQVERSEEENPKTTEPSKPSRESSINALKGLLTRKTRIQLMLPPQLIKFPSHLGYVDLAKIALGEIIKMCGTFLDSITQEIA